MLNPSINDFVKVGRTLYKYNGRHYRLTGLGITPNCCWVIAPIMIEIVDFDVATGLDIRGKTSIGFDATGSIGKCEFVQR